MVAGRAGIDLQANLAGLQLVILSVIDPTGVAAFVVSALASVLLTYESKAHSRAAESEADETGLELCTAACFEASGSSTALLKLQRAAGNQSKQHASWLDTHPAEADRVRALRAQARTLGEPPQHCTSRMDTLRAAFGSGR